MPDNQNKLSKFWHELKRRKVVSVIVAYITVAVAIMYFAQFLENAFELPKWFDKLITIILLIGFPIAIILSWIFDVSSKGITKTEQEPEKESATSNKSANEKSIVVLPFQNMSSDPEQEYFSDGIAEEIINSLTNLSELKVIARTSAFSFKNQNIDVREIGKKLDVNYLLEGSVRKGKNKLRITAQLINLTDGSHLYSERFDSELVDIFDIQDEITAAIVEKLKIKLLANEKKTVYKHHTDNSELFDLYLLARFHAFRFTPDGFQMTSEYIDQIKKINDGYAPAYLLEGFLYHVKSGGVIQSLPTSEGMTKAMTSYKKAIEIDSQMSEAYAQLAYCAFSFNRNLNSAKNYIEKAVELDPKNTEVLRNYSLYLWFAGQKEKSLEISQQTIELDPLSPICYQNASALLAWDGQYQKSIEYSLRGLELNPQFLAINWFLGFAYYHSGEHVKALKTWEAGVQYFSHIVDMHLGYVYAKEGEQKKLERLIQRWESKRDKLFASELEMAYVQLGFGNKDRALQYLNSAVDESPANSIIVATFLYDPSWNQLKGDPEFIKITAKVWKND